MDLSVASALVLMFAGCCCSHFLLQTENLQVKVDCDDDSASAPNTWCSSKCHTSLDG